MMTVKINNMPETATHRRWIVVLIGEGQAWYYDSWDDDRELDAQWQAAEVEGLVVENTAWLKL